MLIFDILIVLQDKGINGEILYLKKLRTGFYTYLHFQSASLQV